MLHGWKVNRNALPPTFFLLQRPGPESLRNGKEGQGLFLARSGLAENPRARYAPAGRTLPGPGLRRRPRPRWEFEQDRASGKQMPGRWARPDTHLASQKIHCQEGQAKNPPFRVAPGKPKLDWSPGLPVPAGGPSRSPTWPIAWLFLGRFI